MRKLLLFIPLILFAPTLYAQIGGGGTNVGGGALVRLFPGVPSGACTAGQLAQNNATGDLYSCLAGSWHEVGGGGGGGGTVTNTGTLTAGHAVVGNGSADITVDPIWVYDGGGGLLAQDDDAQLNIKSTDGTTSITSFNPGSFQIQGPAGTISGNATTGNLSVPQSVLANTVTPDVALDMSDGPGDIIDSTGSHGIVGKFLGSNGTDGGVTWFTAPLIAYSNTAVSQVAAITDTTMLTVGGTSGAFRFSGTINCDTTSAAATATLNLKWTDTGSQAHTISSAAACTALGASSFANQVTYIRAKTGTTITWGVTIANTPTFDTDVRLETL